MVGARLKWMVGADESTEGIEMEKLAFVTTDEIVIENSPYSNFYHRMTFDESM